MTCNAVFVAFQGLGTSWAPSAVGEGSTESLESSSGGCGQRPPAAKMLPSIRTQEGAPSPQGSALSDLRPISKTFSATGRNAWGFAETSQGAGVPRKQREVRLIRWLFVRWGSGCPTEGGADSTRPASPPGGRSSRRCGQGWLLPRPPSWACRWPCPPCAAHGHPPARLCPSLCPSGPSQAGRHLMILFLLDRLCEDRVSAHSRALTCCESGLPQKYGAAQMGPQQEVWFQASKRGAEGRGRGARGCRWSGSGHASCGEGSPASELSIGGGRDGCCPLAGSCVLCLVGQSLSLSLLGLGWPRAPGSRFRALHCGSLPVWAGREACERGRGELGCCGPGCGCDGVLKPLPLGGWACCPDRPRPGGVGGPAAPGCEPGDTSSALAPAVCGACTPPPRGGSFLPQRGQQAPREGVPPEASQHAWPLTPDRDSWKPLPLRQHRQR